MILMEYTLEVRPETGAKGMTAAESHVAIVIDYATNVFKVAEIRPELHYWQHRLTARHAEAPQLAGYLKRVLAAFQQVPQYGPRDQPTKIPVELFPELSAMGVPDEVPVSKSAEEVFRFLRHYYTITPITGRMFDPAADRIRILQIASPNLGLDEALKAVPLVELYIERMKNGQATQKEVRECFKKLGIFLEALPNYQDRKEEMMLVT